MTPQDDNDLSQVVEFWDDYYSRDESPISALFGIYYALEFNKPIPEHLSKYLHESIHLYLSGKGDISLDKCFGFTDNEGPNNLFNSRKLQNRNRRLVRSVERLTRLGLKRPTSIRLALTQEGNPISEKRLANIISSQKNSSPAAKLAERLEIRYLKNFINDELDPNDLSALKKLIAKIAKEKAEVVSSTQ